MSNRAPDQWTASQYVKFEDERTRPVRDLLAAIPRTGAAHAVDLGCGPGNSTEALMARFPGAVVTGIDQSDDMLAAARKRLPGVVFEAADITAWQPAQAFDVIFANASLQWVPDHARLYPGLVDKLAPGGVLAVQTPDNLDEPAHRLMRDVAASGPWAARLGKAARTARADATWYYALLRPLCTRVDVWRTIYYHPLAGGPAAVVEWFKGSALQPFLKALDPTEQKDFLARYEAALAGAYPTLADGTVLLPFPRLFVVATR